MSKTKPLFDVPKRKQEKTIDGYTKRDFVSSDEIRDFYKKRYIEDIYNFWTDCESFNKVIMKYYDKISELEKNQKLTKEEKNGIKKLAEFEASEYIKTLPDITKFKGYLDEFGIEYRHHIPPEEEYKDLEVLPVLDYSKQIESQDFSKEKLFE